MYKKWSSAILSLSLALSMGTGAASAAASSSSDLNVLLNGKALSIAQSAKLVNGRTMLPFRAIGEQLGATVSYEAASKSVTLKKGANVYVLKLGSKIAMVNGVSTTLDVPAQVIGNSTFVPVRFLSENMGLQVGYENKSRTVTLVNSASPSFKVYGVNQDGILYGEQVKVSVAAFNHELADFRVHKDAKDGQGHVHLWLDTDPADPKAAYKLVSGEPVVFDNVAPGEHTLTVQLVGNNHKPVLPAVKQVVHFKTATAAAEAKAYQVNISNFAYAPNEITVPVGSKITFTNDDAEEHTVTAKDGAFDTGLFGKGESKTITFSAAGEYEVYCKPHPFMKLKITVK
jgi:plastocyanin